MLHALFCSQLAYAGGATNTEPGLALGILVICLGIAALLGALWRMGSGAGPTN